MRRNSILATLALVAIVALSVAPAAPASVPTALPAAPGSQLLTPVATATSSLFTVESARRPCPLCSFHVPCPPCP